ncbi:MAG TPA: hypothetical protein VFS39_11560 [Nitrospira sp.]|nr:hypothetical protein [Nitrospira sp.]
MRCCRRLMVMAALSGLLAGCAGEVVKPVGLDVALRGVEEDMKAAAGVSLYDLLGGDAVQEEEFKRTIRHEQCFYRKANPLVPVINKDFTLTLQGTFTGQGRFLVFGVPVPTGGIEVSSARALQQTLSLPVNFTSISSLPDVYLQQKAAYVKDFPDAEKAKYLEESLKDRDVIRAKVKELMAAYSEERCRNAAGRETGR